MRHPKFTIEQVTRANYRLFDDMVYWRINGVELTRNQKEINKTNIDNQVYKELEHPGFCAYAALCDERFVGWITLMYTPKIGRGRWKKGVIYIDELWTAPEYRGQGIAKQLMKKAFDYQQITGAVEIRVYVSADNIIAQELYKKCGMQAMGQALFMKSKQI